MGDVKLIPTRRARALWCPVIGWIELHLEHKGNLNNVSACDGGNGSTSVACRGVR